MKPPCLRWLFYNNLLKSTYYWTKIFYNSNNYFIGFSIWQKQVCFCEKMTNYPHPWWIFLQPEAKYSYFLNSVLFSKVLLFIISFLSQATEKLAHVVKTGPYTVCEQLLTVWRADILWWTEYLYSVVYMASKDTQGITAKQAS